MMTALLTFAIADFVLGAACLVWLAKISARKLPEYPDCDAIARAILRSPFDAADVRDAMEFAAQQPKLGRAVVNIPVCDHYFVAHSQGGVERIVYDGSDSDAAYDAHRDMELNPDQYPGRHTYRRNGKTIVDRLHSEIQL